MKHFFRALIAGLATFGILTPLFGAILSKEGAVALAYLCTLLVFVAVVGGWAAFQSWLYGRSEPKFEGWRRYWNFCTDHKVVGIQYLVISGVIFSLAGTMALVMRTELAHSGLQFLDNSQYNTVMGMHGMGMVIVALIAIVGGLGNYFVPLMIGAEDMAFPRLNALSFWMLPCAVLILLSTFAAGGFDFGWTAYPPLAIKGPLGKLFFVLAFLTAGFSSIFGGINFITTICQLRAKGMTWFRTPIFVWSILSASMIILLATSVVATGLLMIVADRVLGSSFFDPNRGGNVLMYQHLFWFYSHPAVYIMILPAFGVILEVLPVFARKPLFAYPIAAVSLIAIVAISFIVWAHHMFTSGMWKLLDFPFMVTTEMISVPTGIVFFSALGTIWRGKLRMKSPMIWALGWIYQFLIGGLTGIFLADVPTDLHLQDTWFVMAHFHFTIVGGAIWGLFTGLHFWFPKMTGHYLSEKLAKVQFWLFLIGFNATFLPMFWLGTRGMRRRVADYPPEWNHVQTWISCAALLIAASFFVFVYNVIQSIRHGQKAPANPWDSNTFEWQVSSPPPVHNFDRPPEVTDSPYHYGQIN
jgi:cytochrome c oxidase subunit 1